MHSITRKITHSIYSDTESKKELNFFLINLFIYYLIIYKFGYWLILSFYAINK